MCAAHRPHCRTDETTQTPGEATLSKLTWPLAAVGVSMQAPRVARGAFSRSPARHWQGDAAAASVSSACRGYGGVGPLLNQCYCPYYYTGFSVHEVDTFYSLKTDRVNPFPAHSNPSSRFLCPCCVVTFFPWGQFASSHIPNQPPYFFHESLLS